MTKVSKVLRLAMDKAGELVTTEELAAQGYPEKDVSRILSKLANDGVIYKISRGVYSKDPPESLDIFYLARRLFPGYLGMASACYLHGWLEYFPFEICVITKARSSSRQIGKFTVRAVALGEKAVGSCVSGRHVLSSKGKTLFDIFYKPELAGGWKEVMKIVHKSDASRGDWEEFLGFASRFGSNSFMQRAGYLISRLGEKTGRKIPLDPQRLKPANMAVARLGSGKAAGFSKIWQIVDCVGDELFGWYDGS